MKHWILIADAARASIFVPHFEKKELESVREFSHPLSRAKNSEISADRPGQAQHAHSGSFAPAMAGPTDAKVYEAEQFARELAHELKHDNDLHEFDRIALVAPSHFLGLLRQALDAQVRHRIACAIPMDLTPMQPRELWPHLRDVIRALSREQTC